jgi:hypothetical protein
MMSLAGAAEGDGDASGVGLGDSLGEGLREALGEASGLADDEGLVTGVTEAVLLQLGVQDPTSSMSPASNVQTRHPPLIYVSARIVSQGAARDAFLRQEFPARGGGPGPGTPRACAGLCGRCRACRR